MILNPASAKCKTMHILVVTRHPQDHLRKNVIKAFRCQAIKWVHHTIHTSKWKYETIRINGVVWKSIFISVTMNSRLQKCNNYIMFYFKCVRNLVWLTDRLHGSKLRWILPQNLQRFMSWTQRSHTLRNMLNHKHKIDWIG